MIGNGNATLEQKINGIVELLCKSLLVVASVDGHFWSLCHSQLAFFTVLYNLLSSEFHCLQAVRFRNAGVEGSVLTFFPKLK